MDAPEPAWPEGEYVQPARPRPTLGAANGRGAHEPAPHLRTAACLAYVSTPAGYQVVPVGSEATEVGAVIEIEGHGALVVVRHARSPLPHDDRTCLVVEPSVQPWSTASPEPPHELRGGRAYTHSGPLAQLVEQGTFNPKVAGSRPARPIHTGIAVPVPTVGRR